MYYGDFEDPPAGASFDSQWGFQDAFSNTSRGDWREYKYSDVVAVIKRRAGNPDLTSAKQASKAARQELERGKGEAASILSTSLIHQADPLIDELKSAAADVLAATEQQYNDAVLPRGQISSHDMRAITDGVYVPPHLAVSAEVLGIRSPFEACEQLAAIAQRAATHLRRLDSGRTTPKGPLGTTVFLGHGRSPLWRELKDFVHERLGLPWDEFNRVPVAGISNIERLLAMLDSAAFALLILTAEDELADGSSSPRMNVVHEAGLFQGRLGFAKAIVLLEEGCAEFSNIEGLGQIRFPRGEISSVFERVRLVLEREGLIEP